MESCHLYFLPHREARSPLLVLLVDPYLRSLVSGKVLCEFPQVLSAVLDSGFLGRERFEIQNGQNGRWERIGASTDNGGCILDGSDSPS